MPDRRTFIMEQLKPSQLIESITDLLENIEDIPEDDPTDYDQLMGELIFGLVSLTGAERSFQLLAQHYDGTKQEEKT